MEALNELQRRKVFHRDVKPANVMAVPEAEHALKPIEFGSSSDGRDLLKRISMMIKVECTAIHYSEHYNTQYCEVLSSTFVFIF